MKKIILFLFASVLFVSCSSDGAQDELNAATEQSVQHKVAKDIYPQFDNLFRGLYGSAYFISNTSVNRSENGVNFRLTEVFASSGSTSQLGMFVESEGTVTYYANDQKLRVITAYTYTGTGYASSATNVSQDPVYLQGGTKFNINQPSQPGQTTLGWGQPYLSNDCVDGKRYWYQDYRVLGIKLKSRKVMALDGSEQLWAPCE